MDLKKSKLVILAVSSPLLIFGCATTPEECDPNAVNSMFVASSCLLTGSMQEAVEKQRKELERLIKDRKLAELELVYLESQSEKLAKDSEAFKEHIRDNIKELEELRIGWSEKQSKSDKEEARKLVMLEEIEKLKTELETQKNITVSNREEILALTKDVERRRSVLDALTDEGFAE